MYRQVHTRLSDNASYINDLYKELRTILDTDQPDKTISELAVKIRDCEYVGILTPDGESARGQMLDDGETHSEFYVDEASIAENLGKIIDLRDATDEVITEDEMDILQDDFSEDEEISLE
jgi:hypothetical protein